MDKAIIFGAGNIGRGFIGPLYSESGYELTFVDIDEPLIGALNDQRAYTLRLVDNTGQREVRVGPVSALNSKQEEAVTALVATATLGATAVGARALEYIAPLVAQGIALRARQAKDAPLNLIICENLKDAARIFADKVAKHLAPQEREYMLAHVGFVNTVIGRMVPQPTEEMRRRDVALIVAEPYKELPVERAGFVGPPPDVVGMVLCDHFAAYTARKLYLHNAGHAVLGYLGYLRGHSLGYQALEDPVIYTILLAAWEEALGGIVAAHSVDEAWLREHVADLSRRFANRALADPVVRLGRDPLRKLGPNDRLVGAARLAESAGIVPRNLAWGIAGGLLFDPPGDRMARVLQENIAQNGVEAVLRQVCQVEPDEPLGEAIIERYHKLRKDRWS